MMNETMIALEVTSRLLDDITGSCPLDRFNWSRPDGCEEVCATAACGDEDNPTWRCWALWAKEDHSDG